MAENSFFSQNNASAPIEEDLFAQQNGGTHEGDNAAFNSGFGGPFDAADFTDGGAAQANGINEHASGVSGQFAPPREEPEAVVAMKEHLKQRLADGEEAEIASKKKTEEEAQAFLQDFYEKRHATKEARIQEHREAHKLLGSQKPEGANGWERAISLIDFNFTRPSGSDLSRYRNVLFNAKGRSTAVS